ncbi:hypothetical protein FD16_GL002033 [Paucilactobacillus suebicus DSM 5007 = KCTC 3549]|uniref:Uncharacterized protein n=2 Tax=Paucilactobacillus suebicus TaxID=152335 RepID=A0A0R1WDC5_9LACO|nr:hypothetical protein FD16_GL002033 [Paucilactobacillus suebicus DSM 5007 = KCTC 3549]
MIFGVYKLNEYRHDLTKRTRRQMLSMSFMMLASITLLFHGMAAMIAGLVLILAADAVLIHMPEDNSKK